MRTFKWRHWRCLLERRRCSTSAATTQFKPKTIETVSPTLHKYLFGDVAVPSTSSATSVPIELPPLAADNIVDHFGRIADEQTSPYSVLLEAAAKFDLDVAKKALSQIDKNRLWVLRTGWTKYSFDGDISPVDFPSDDALFFDVEVCVIEGNLPTLAIALGNDAWYGWCSDRLVNDTDVRPISEIAQQDLIPLGDLGKERVIIGHNVGYDRSRCREAYNRNDAKIRFMDTMSMSIPMFGMADHQQALYEKSDLEDEERVEWLDAWKERVSKNSLVAVHDHFYFDSQKTASADKKAMRASFVKDSIDVIRDDFSGLMTYCANDNVMCAEIFVKLWPLFKQRFPHSASLAGMLNMGNAYLPINQNWSLFYQKNMDICASKKAHAARKIIAAARNLMETRTSGKDDDEEKDSTKSTVGLDDVWLWNQSGEISAKLDYPGWFLKLFKQRNFASLPIEDLQPDHIILKSSLIPSVFGLLYGPYPLMKTRKHGWGYLVPTNSAAQASKTEEVVAIPAEIWRSGVEAVDFPVRKFVSLVKQQRFELGDIPLPADKKRVFAHEFFTFYQLPHPSGEGNVGDPLTKHFAKDLEQKVLRPTRYLEEFEVVRDSLQTTQFWTSYSERIRQEIVVWYKQGSSDLPSTPAGNREQTLVGAIAPAIIPAGTVSRRSVHKLWVTLTNQSTTQVIGTGIKSMVQAPEGFRLVGADVDSQEQWLAGLFGDACEEKVLPVAQRIAGKTAFSNMMLVGAKSDGTDLHSVVAKQLSISRNNAKLSEIVPKVTLNYARLYGSGQIHAARHLTLLGGMRESEAERVAHELFRITKGEDGKWKKLHKNAAPLLQKYKADGGELNELSVDGDFYLPDYSNRLSRGTKTFEDWVLRLLVEQRRRRESEGGQIDEGILQEAVVPRLYDDFVATRRLYFGGYESSTFNFLELAAESEFLRTPVLGCQLADSLSALPSKTPQAHSYRRKYKRSVMNWIVQSSAVDFLHLLLVSMEWLCRTHDIEVRFVISIHDEVRYLCREEDAPRVGLALMLSNLLVRAFISAKVGIPQLPATVAFFSQVDCDTVLRKEVDVECTNPDGGVVSKGIAWNIDDLLKLTGGKLGKPKTDRS